MSLRIVISLRLKGFSNVKFNFQGTCVSQEETRLLLVCLFFLWRGRNGVWVYFSEGWAKSSSSKPSSALYHTHTQHVPQVTYCVPRREGGGSFLCTVLSRDVAVHVPCETEIPFSFCLISHRAERERNFCQAGYRAYSQKWNAISSMDFIVELWYG